MSEQEIQNIVQANTALRNEVTVLDLFENLIKINIFHNMIKTKIFNF